MSDQWKQRSESHFKILIIHQAQHTLRTSVICIAAAHYLPSPRNPFRQLQGSLIRLAPGIHIVYRLQTLRQNGCKQLRVHNLRRLDHLSVDHKVGILFRLRLYCIYHLFAAMSHIAHGDTGNQIHVALLRFSLFLRQRV